MEFSVNERFDLLSEVKKRELFERIIRELPITATVTKQNFKKMDIWRPLSDNISPDATPKDRLNLFQLCDSLMNEMFGDEDTDEMEDGIPANLQNLGRAHAADVRDGDLDEFHSQPLMPGEDDRQNLVRESHLDSILDKIRETTEEDEYQAAETQRQENLAAEVHSSQVAPRLLPFINRGLKAGKKTKRRKTKRRKTRRNKKTNKK